MSVNRRQFEVIMILTALYGAETWNTRSAKEEIKCNGDDVSEECV